MSNSPIQSLAESVSDLYYKFRIWGIRGAFNYFARLFKKNRTDQIIRVIRDNAVRHSATVPKRGITLIGPLSSSGSLNKTLRDLAFTLKDANIPFQTFDIGCKEIPEEDVAPILTSPDAFDINKYTHVVEMFSTELPELFRPNSSRIVFWEFTSGLIEGTSGLVRRKGSIIAMSDFNYHYFRKVFKDRERVFKIRYPLRVPMKGVLSRNDARQKFGIRQDAFVVFYNFSFSSGWNRKNAMGVLKAFVRAFPSEERAFLVFKTSSASRYEKRMSELLCYAERSGVAHRVMFYNDYLAQADVLSLTNACDVYLSLHRAEGFGIGIAEAMSLGKAVVVTGYSAPTEFCDQNNSVRVPCRLVRAASATADCPWYVAVNEWAEPDEDFAVASLKRLYEDEDYRTQLGRRARKTINEHYSVRNVGDSIRSFLATDDCSA